MNTKIKFAPGVLVVLMFFTWGCKTPKQSDHSGPFQVPVKFSNHSGDTSNIAGMNWRSYFNDSNLTALIDTALQNNRELMVLLQEIEVSRNEIRARKGEYLPFIRAGAGAGFEKPGKFTPAGALEDQLEVKPGRKFPDPLPDYSFGFSASWEPDIWKKLRNAKKSAVMKYLSDTEGRNFMVTNLIAEISSDYYELMALDNMLGMIEKNIEIQSDALKVVKQQKLSAQVTQLAVNRFEAQLLHTRNMQFSVKQKIVETENHINFLTGRFPAPVKRNSDGFLQLNPGVVHAGIPAKLLANRPDIRQAEYNLAASRLDVQVARARFYPSVGIRAGIGYQAFNPSFLLHPESLLYDLAGDLAAPLINRNAIFAAYNSANARQLQALYTYQQTILNAYIDVVNQLSKIDNYEKSYEMKSREVGILMQSVTIANNLFNSARADYAEVLFTQREALDSKMEMIETQLLVMHAKVGIYRALGGGWK